MAKSFSGNYNTAEKGPENMVTGGRGAYGKKKKKRMRVREKERK